MTYKDGQRLAQQDIEDIVLRYPFSAPHKLLSIKFQMEQDLTGLRNTAEMLPNLNGRVRRAQGYIDTLNRYLRTVPGFSLDNTTPGEYTTK